MSDKFYFTAELRESNKRAIFQSETGEDYYVCYEAAKSGEIVVNVQWILQKQNLVKVELFASDFKQISSQMLIGDGNTCFKFCVTPKENEENERDLVFVITIIPYIRTTNSSVTCEDKEEDENDDKIGHLTEDLLVGLGMDMRDLFIHGDLSDAMITNGDYVLKVHAAILSARSPVFREAFTDPSSERVITVPDASADALKDFVMFIYSGLIKIKDMDRAEELYELACKYEIEDLRATCSAYMSNCTIDSVLRTLVIAHKYKDDELKKSLRDFVVSNIIKLKSCEKWESFIEHNMDLASEISSYVTSAPEKDVLHAFLSKLPAKK